MKTLIIYDGSTPGSVISAAIALRKYPASEVLDTEGIGFKITPKKWDKIFLMTEVDEAELTNNMVYVSGRTKEKTRSVLTWEREFGGQSCPLALHYLGGYKLNEANREKAESFYYAVATYLSDLTDAHVKYDWNELMNNNLGVLNSYCTKGSVIRDYLSVNAPVETDDSAFANMAEEIHAQAAEISKLTQDNVALDKQVKETSAALKAINKELNDSLSVMAKVDDISLIHAMTPKQVADRYTVSELRKIAPRVGGIKGYSNLKQADLVKALRSRIKSIFKSGLVNA